MDTLKISRVSETQWQAVDRELIVGNGDVAQRPDGRLFVSIDVWEAPVFDRLAAAMLPALPTSLTTVVGEADAELRTGWERAGFTLARRVSEYDVPTAPQSATATPGATATPPVGVTILPAGTADEAQLRALDRVIRAEVEATVGWAAMPAEIRSRPAGDTLVDPSLYAVAVRDGRYAGLVRTVVLRGRARIGLLAVRAEDQRHGIGRALLGHTLDALHQDGISSAWADVDDSNTAALSLLAEVGARRVGGCLELVRH